MKKIIMTLALMAGMTVSAAAQDVAQKDSVYVVKNGVVVGAYEVGKDVDCLTFTKPSTPDAQGNYAKYGDTTEELRSAYVTRQSGLLYVLVSTVAGQTTYDGITGAGNYLCVAIPESMVGQELKLADYADSDDYLQAYYMDVDYETLAGASIYDLSDNGYADGTIKVDLTDGQVSVTVGFTPNGDGTAFMASYTGAYATDAQDTNLFNVDTESNQTKAAFYKVNEDEATVDLYLTIAPIDDAKKFEDCRQTVHLTVPYSALWSGAFDITGDTDFKLDFTAAYGDEKYSFSKGNVGNATGTINVTMQSEGSYAVDINIDGFGHSLRVVYGGEWMPYDLSTPNAYAWQNGESVQLRSAVVAHANGLYTVYLSQREGVTTVAGMADADIVAVTPEEYLNDGLKGFSGDETRAKISITCDGVTYCQANTTNGGDNALGMGGNVNLQLSGDQLAIDFALFNIYKYSNANLSGHFEGTATVVE